MTIRVAFYARKMSCFIYRESEMIFIERIFLVREEWHRNQVDSPASRIPMQTAEYVHSELKKLLPWLPHLF